MTDHGGVLLAMIAAGCSGVLVGFAVGVVVA